MAVLAAVNFLTRRDTLYLLRPTWDTKQELWNTYSFWPYVPAVEANADYCGHYGWEDRPAMAAGPGRRPRIVDATLLSTEASLLKLRLMEMRDHVDVVILVEADRSFDGTPKPHFPVFNETEIRRQIRFPPDEKNPWENEGAMRRALADIILDRPRWHGVRVRAGDLILMSDVDEIPSREALHLARVCAIPPVLHLNMKNYWYSFEFTLNNNGYWRARVRHRVTFGATPELGYNSNHVRESDEPLLHRAGTAAGASARYRSFRLR